MAEYVVIDKEQLESDLTVVADSIREKGGTSEQLAFPNGMADAVRGIQSGGEDNIKYVTTFANMFANAEFPSGYVLDLNLEALGKKVSNGICSLNYFFQNATGVEKIILRTSQKDVNVSLYGAFNKTSAKEIDLSEFPVLISSATQAFYHNYDVEIIKGTLKFADTVTNIANMFGSSTNLKEVRFAENNIPLSITFGQSPSLSDASRKSIIKGLADLTGGTSQTVTFHPTVKGQLTDEEKAEATAKNWTIP